MLTLRRLDPRDPRSEQELQELLSATPRYTERVSGVSFCPPGAAREALDVTPPNTTSEQKFVFVIGDAVSGPVGCVDLIRDYPVVHCAFLGLLTIRESHQGRGLGRKAYSLIESQARSWDCRKIRLAYVSTNPEAKLFWAHMGFAETGEQREYQNGSVRGQHIVMEKSI